MEEVQFEENFEEYLREKLISCEKCHFCHTVCPIVESRVTQGPFGINRSIYYGLKWNQLNEDLRNLIYSCTTCGKCVEMCKKVSRALPLVDIFEKAREYFLVVRSQNNVAKRFMNIAYSAKTKGAGYAIQEKAEPVAVRGKGHQDLGNYRRIEN